MAKKKVYQPSIADLQGAPDKFLYELNMFKISASVLENPAVLGKQLILKNVILESALVHSRNILDFLCGEESSRDDIIAGHFAKNKDGSPWKSSNLRFLRSCKDDINKALSHLTYTRIKNKPRWNISRIRQEIEDAYNEFLYQLPEQERSKWRV